eukprot:scpid26951/ scgid11539/ 
MCIHYKYYEYTSAVRKVPVKKNGRQAERRLYSCRCHAVMLTMHGTSMQLLLLLCKLITPSDGHTRQAREPESNGSHCILGEQTKLKLKSSAKKKEDGRPGTVPNEGPSPKEKIWRSIKMTSTCHHGHAPAPHARHHNHCMHALRCLDT